LNCLSSTLGGVGDKLSRCKATGFGGGQGTAEFEQSGFVEDNGAVPVDEGGPSLNYAQPLGDQPPWLHIPYLGGPHAEG